ncbi:hypothetical protein NXV12_06155 [Bacteroides thetaiotaomicron]|jgi:hypothetical protein|nr:hypothetical protein [Bacteroides thetaiotaomicron]
MKNDDLERLEKSQDVQQLIHFAKEQYEQEKSEHTPADFSSLMQAVRKNQKKRMRLKVSPWWLTAACLLGWTIGYGFRVEVIRNLIRLPLSLQSLIR